MFFFLFLECWGTRADVFSSNSADNQRKFTGRNGGESLAEVNCGTASVFTLHRPPFSPVFAFRTSVIDDPLSRDDQEEFVRLLSEHSSRIMSYIRILAFGRQFEADEIFQQTCLVLWQKFSQYDTSGSFGAWACKIAYFEVLKQRKTRRRVQVLSDEALESLAVAAIPISTQINDRRSALARCLEKLPVSDHEFIELRYFDGQSIQEISDRVGRSTHAIYREFSRIHGMLSRCVHRSLGERAND